jgi:cardiolipin synthase
MRNHRKLVVIDNKIAWCGSQNCADPEFLGKKRYGPWVDIMAKCKGPVVWQSQHMFVGDWMSATDENLLDLLELPEEEHDGGIIAQVIGSGPADQHSGMPQLFATLLYNARDSVVITTPYYVPNETMQSALCACARRGVETSVIFPRHNDSRIVAGASRSYYSELLASGVRIHEYEPGLLHAKTFTMDDEISLIGSANMDRRSFELNFENNVLVQDKAFTAQLRRQQLAYLASSHPVTLEEVQQWSLPRRLIQNTKAVLGPLL